jgi:hypothetical protein
MHDGICRKIYRESPLLPICKMEDSMSTAASSLNPGVADLLQTLTNVNSPVMNSPAVVSALEKAPTSDIVQLSAEATQLQSVDALFGISSTPAASTVDALFGLTPPPASSDSSVLQAMETAGATVSPTDQAANGQAAIQAQLTQGLFGTGTNNSLSGTLFNALA